MLALARQSLHGRARIFVSLFLIAVFASATVTAGGVLVDSALRAEASPERYAAAPIVVAARQELPDPLQADQTMHLPERARVPIDALDAVRAIPGVEAAVADRAMSVALPGEDVPEGLAIVGQGWESGALWPVTLQRGRVPNDDHEVVLDAALARAAGRGVGDDVRIVTADGSRRYTVVGVSSAPERAGRRQIPVFFTDAEAERVARDPSRVEVIGVFLRDSSDPEAVADRMRTTLDPGLVVLTGRDRAVPETHDLVVANRQVVEFGGAFGSTAAMLAVFVLAATLGTIVLHRAREMALLRAVGATPGQVRRLVIGESTIVALIGGVIGVPPGFLLAAGLLRVAQNAGPAAGTAVRYGIVPPVVAVAIGVATAGIAALIASRRAARLRPMAALSGSLVERRQVGWFRGLLGVALLAGGIALSVAAGSLDGEAGASAAIGVLLTLALGVAAVGPVLLRVGARLATRPLTSGSTAARLLAAINLAAGNRRYASVATPIVLAVALAITMVGSLATEADATLAQARDRLVADRIVTAPGGSLAGVADEVRALGSTAGVVEVAPTSVGLVRSELFDEPVFEFRPAVGIGGHEVELVLDLDVVHGSLEHLRGDATAVSEEIARSADLDVGDDVAVWLGDGTEATLRVVAIFGRSLGFGDLVVPLPLVEGHAGSRPGHLLIVGAADADPVVLDGSLAAVVAEVPGAAVLDRMAFHAGRAQAARDEAATNHVFIGVLIAFVVVAAINGLVLATAQRRPEFAVLRLTGSTRSQVLTMVRWETGGLVAYATALGLAIAAATLVPFSSGLTGTPVPAVPLGFLGAIVAGAFLLAMIATEVACRLALRLDPIEAARGSA